MFYLRMRFRDPQAMLDVIRPRGPGGLVLMRPRARLAVGAPLIVEIGTCGLARPVLLKGIVSAVATASRLTEVALIEGQATKRDFLLSLARGVPFRERRRRDRRFPADASVDFLHAGSTQRMLAQLVDVSVRGARVVTATPLAKSQVIDLRFPQVGTAHRLAVAGRVVWTRDGAAGLEHGVQFRSRDHTGVCRAKEIVRRHVLNQLDASAKIPLLGSHPS